MDRYDLCNMDSKNSLKKIFTAGVVICLRDIYVPSLNLTLTVETG
jgi:hypothetical protein